MCVHPARRILWKSGPNKDCCEVQETSCRFLPSCSGDRCWLASIQNSMSSWIFLEYWREINEEENNYICVIKLTMWYRFYLDKSTEHIRTSAHGSIYYASFAAARGKLVQLSRQSRRTVSYPSAESIIRKICSHAIFKVQR